MKAPIWLFTLSCVVLAGCASPKSSEESKPALITGENVSRLYGREWELKTLTLDSRRIVMHVDARMTLAFTDKGQAGGYGSVNQFHGPYEVAPNGSLTWLGPTFATTRKAGPPELMDKERAYLQALRQTTMAIITKDALQLQNQDGSTVLAFQELGK